MQVDDLTATYSVSSAEIDLRIAAQANNFLSIVRTKNSDASTVSCDELLRVTPEVNAEGRGEAYKTLIEESLDPEAILKSMHGRVAGDADSAESECTDFAPFLKFVHNIRTKNWIKRLKTPLALHPAQEKGATAKIMSLISAMVRSPRDDPNHATVLWAIVDVYQLSYYFVLSCVMEFLENMLSCAEDTEARRILHFIRRVSAIIPEFKGIMHDMVEKRIRAYAAEGGENDESAQFTHIFRAAAGKLGLKGEHTGEVESAHSYYFLPKLPVNFTKIVAYLIQAEVLCLRSILYVLFSESHARESKALTHAYFADAYIPHAFYQAIFVDYLRHALAKQKKTAIEIEGPNTGALCPKSCGAVEDSLLYLGLSRSAAKGSPSGLQQMPQVLTDNPYVDLLAALYEIANQGAAGDGNAQLLLGMLESCLNLAAVRVSGLQGPEASKHEFPSLESAKPFLNSCGASDASEASHTFSVFDYQKTFARGKFIEIVCATAVRKIQRASGEDAYAPVCRLLDKLRFRIYKSPALLTAILSTDSLRTNARVLRDCIQPAFTVYLAKHDFMPTRALEATISPDVILHYQLQFSSQAKAFAQFYEKSGTQKAIESPADEPVMTAMKQVHFELVHYKIIRLVPNALHNTQRFFHDMWTTSPGLLINVLIDQSMKKEDPRFIELVSQLFALPQTFLADDERPGLRIASIYTARLLLLSALCHTAAKTIQRGELSLHEQIGQIAAVATLYFKSCLAMIHDLYERAQGEPSAGACDYSTYAFCTMFIRKAYGIIFHNIIQDKANKIGCLVFLKSFAEHFLFQPCMSEAGWCAPQSESGAFQPDAYLDHIGAIAFARNTTRRALFAMGDTAGVSLAEAERQVVLDHHIGKLMHWFSGIGNGYASFLGSQPSAKDANQRLVPALVILLIFFEESAGLGADDLLAPSAHGSFMASIHQLLWEIESLFTESAHEELYGYNSNKDAVLASINRLINVCNDLKKIFRVEDANGAAATDKDLEEFSVCFRAQAYDSLAALELFQGELQPSSRGIERPSDLHSLLADARADTKKFLCTMKHYIQRAKGAHLADARAMHVAQLANHTAGLTLPTVPSVFAAVTESLEKAIHTGFSLCAAAGYSPLQVVSENSQSTLRHASFLQTFLKEVIALTFSMIPAFTSAECVSIGVFVNIVLTYFHSVQCDFTDRLVQDTVREVEAVVIPALKRNAPVSIDAPESVLEEALVAPTESPRAPEPLYIQQNYLTLLWEIRYHLTAPAAVSTDTADPSATAFMCTFGKADSAQATLYDVLNSMQSQNERAEGMALIQPQIIALLKWLKNTEAKEQSAWYLR